MDWGRIKNGLRENCSRGLRLDGRRIERGLRMDWGRTERGLRMDWELSED